MILPRYFYLLGLILWYIVISPNSIHEVRSRRGATDFELKEGFYIAVSVIVIDSILLIYGLLRIRKLFMRR